jgi:hypothetical protein
MVSLKVAFEALDEVEREAVRKLWRLQRQAERKARALKRSSCKRY